MNIQELVSILVNSGIEQNEATKEIKMLIEHFCNYSAKDIIMGRPLDYKKLEIVREKVLLRARTKQPIQYIIGEAYFMGDYYKVTPDVLIPRDETELVVRHALNLIKSKDLTSVLDIGTGSGCIACSIAKYSSCKVTSVDISDNALKIAAENSKKLSLNINFYQSDLFSHLPNNQKYDLIISNPPYIPIGTDVQKEVQFEPSIALFTSEKTGTEYYKKIIEEAKNYLNTNGYVVFELGINQSQTVSKMFTQNKFTDITIEKDFSNIDRIISAKLI